MKYIIVFCYMITTTKPVIYKKDQVKTGDAAPATTIVVTSTACDSIKVKDEAAITEFINSVTPAVTIKAIRPLKK